MKSRKFGMVMIAAALAFLAAACSSPFVDKNPGVDVSSGNGRLVLTVNGLLPAPAGGVVSSPKTIMPDPSGLIASYVAVIHDHADGADTSGDIPVPDLVSNSTSIYLPAGTYTVTVMAFDGGGAVIAEGSADVTLIPGESRGVTVTIAPVLDSGTGSFTFKLSFPAGLVDGVEAYFGGAAETLEIVADDDMDRPGNSMVVLTKAGVAAGSYLFSMALTMTGATRPLATFMDAVWIARNLSIAKTVVYTAADFNAAPAAPAGLELTPQLASQMPDEINPGMLLRWNDMAGTEEGFRVYRSETGVEESYAQIDELGAGVESYIDSGLADGTVYYYRVYAYNAFGVSGYTAAFCQAYADSVSEQFVTEGLEALELKDWDLAYSKFTTAAAWDPANYPAQVYAAMINLGAISVDPHIVDLAQNRIGFVGYPTTMDEVFSDTWFTQTWYETEEGFAPVDSPDPNAMYYVRGTLTEDPAYPSFRVYNTPQTYDYYQGYFTPDPEGWQYVTSFYDIDQYQHDCYPGELEGAGYVIETYYDIKDMLTDTVDMMPEIAIPEWAGDLGGGVIGETSEMRASFKYPMYLAANLLERNPNGLNGIIDAVLAGVFGARLDAAIAIVDALPDDATIEFSDQIITAFGGTPEATTFRVYKAQMEMAAASLQNLRSFFQLIASYNLDYPFSMFQVPMWDSTSSGEYVMPGNDGAIPDVVVDLLKSTPNPIEAGFMGDRSQVTRDAARATMLDSIARMRHAIVLLKLLTLDDIAAMTHGYISWAPDTVEELDNFHAILDIEETVAGKLAAAIVDPGITLYVDGAQFETGDVALILPGERPVEDFFTIEFRPSTMYDTDILNPARFLVSSRAPDGRPVGVALFGINPAGRTRIDSLDALVSFSYDGLQIGVDTNRVFELAKPPAILNALFPIDVVDANGILYVDMPIPMDEGGCLEVTNGMWLIIQWLTM